jgi:hypothetical protein
MIRLSSTASRRPTRGTEHLAEMIAHAKAKPKTPAPKKSKTKVIYGRQLFMMVAYEIATALISPLGSTRR